jgi:hypothetical protein
LANDSRRQRADAQFSKAQRAEDGKKAMAQYESDAAAVRAKTERLRALRLARDAAEGAAAPTAVPAKKAAARKAAGAGPKKGGKGGKTAAGSLSGWLKDREGAGHKN